MNNEPMTAGDWVICLLILGSFLFVASFMVYYEGKSERLESQLRGLNQKK